MACREHCPAVQELPWASWLHMPSLAVGLWREQGVAFAKRR